jgi:hypothetical protein
VELEVPATGTVGEPVEISTPTEEVFAPLIEFGDGESVADTEASHVYEESGEYEVKFGGAEVLGYRASTQRAIAILPADEKPSPEPEGESPGPGAPGPKEAPAVSTSAEPPAAAPNPSTQCVAAEAARDSALRHIKLIGARLRRVHDANDARHLAAAERKQVAALRSARRRVAEAC